MNENESLLNPGGSQPFIMTKWPPDRRGSQITGLSKTPPATNGDIQVQVRTFRFTLHCPTGVHFSLVISGHS